MVSLWLCTPNQCVVLIWAVAFSYVGIIVYGAANIKSGFFLDARCANPQAKNKIAITFDDGPHPENTVEIINILKEHNARATFFVKGKNAGKYPDVVLKTYQNGHLIGNHSYEHKFLFPLQCFSGMLSEVSHAQNALSAITGNKIRYFRPPFGVTNPTIARVVKRLNLIVVGWSIRTFDTTRRNREAVLRKVEQNLKAGDIILLHDHTPHVLWLLKSILQLANQRNLEPVTVEELFDE